MYPIAKFRTTEDVQ